MYTLTRRMMKAVMKMVMRTMTKHPRLWPASGWFRPCQPRSPEWTRSPSSPPSRSREELLLTSGGEELLRMEEDKVLLPRHLKRKIKIQGRNPKTILMKIYISLLNILLPCDIVHLLITHFHFLLSQKAIDASD